MSKKAIIISLLLPASYMILVITTWIAYPKSIPSLTSASYFLKAVALEPAFITNNIDKIPQVMLYGLGASIIVPIFTIGRLVHNPNKSGRYGSAAWAKIHQVKDFGLNFKKEGVILGKWNNKVIYSNKPLSTLLLAPPGTGKTAGIIIPTLLSLRNSVIIHDPKGELYSITSSARKEFSDILVFDPVSEKSSVFNVFCDSLLPENKDDLNAYISNIATTLIKSHNDKDKFFVTAARTMFTFYARYLLWKYGHTDIASIRTQFLSSSNIVKSIKEMIEADDVPEELIMDGRNVLTSSEGDAQWAGVVGTLSEALSLFNDSRIVASTSGKNAISAIDFRKHCTSLYLIVRDKDRERLSPLIAMLFDAIGNNLLSIMPSEEDIPVTLLLDEFIRLGKLNTIRMLPALSRGYRVNAIFVAQDFEQISAVYGNEAISEFESNTAYKIIFRQNNYKTAKRLSELIGKVTLKKKTYSKNSGKMGKNVSESEEGIDLVSAEDILNLNSDECVVVIEGFANRPIKASIPFYFKNKKMAKLCRKTESIT